MKPTSRLFKTLSTTVAAALTAALAGPVTPALAASQVIGGVASEGNLRIRVEDSGQMGVERYASGTWVSQIYSESPGSKGSALHINGALYPLGYFMYDAGWSEIGTAGTPVSNTTVGNTITTVWTAGSTTITQTTQYTNGNPFYRLQWQITNTSGGALNDLRFFHGEDTYLVGGDNGAGFWDGANNIVGVYKTVAGNQQRMSLQGVTTPAYYQSESYDAVLIAGGAGRLTNVINPDEGTDNGYAMEWDNATLTAGATWTIVAYESFVSGAVGALNVSAPISTDCAPGATCDLVFTVTNPTGAGIDAALSVTGDPSAWSPTIISPASPVTVPGGGSQSVTVRLTVPAGVSNGTTGSFTLTANDGTTDTSATGAVTIVSAAPSTNANLTSLVLSTASLNPSFDAATTAYTATVSNATTSLTVTPTAADSNATLTVNGNAVASGATSGAIALSVGSNTITTVVTAQDGTTTKTYTVTVTRAPSSNADLSGLALSAGTLTPAFDAATTTYTATVSNATTSLTVTPTAADSNATITVNGNAVASGAASGAIALSVGSNTITTVVTAQDGTTTNTYTVTVTRAPSSNADLSGLALSAGTLTPAFDAATTTYTATVSNATTSLTVTPTAAEANATITVNGNAVASGAASGAIALSVGSNTITTVVTAQDGTTTKTYTVTVTRAPSSNADLSGLALSAGTLTPAFDAATTTYTATVSNATTSLTVTPTVAEANATITVNGDAVTSGAASGAIALSVGANTITTVVTAQDGTTAKTYTVTVTRAPSSNADLSNLQVAPGTLDPAFDPDTLEYSVAVSNSVTSASVIGTTDDPNATIAMLLDGDPLGVIVSTVEGASAPPNVPLAVGANVVTIVVTAEDGVTTRSYTVTINREGAANADLSDLNDDLGGLLPDFAPDVFEYDVQVSWNAGSLTFQPTSSDPNATILVNGAPVTSGTNSGEIALHQGSNVITVTVIAEDGVTTQTYTITVFRPYAQLMTFVARYAAFP